MTGVQLPDRLDVYRENGGGLTLLGANLPGYVELMSAGARNALSAISRKPVAKLWLGEEAQSLLREGMLIFWKERSEWWTVRGRPTLFTQFPGGRVEAPNVVIFTMLGLEAKTTAKFVLEVQALKPGAHCIAQLPPFRTPSIR